MEIHSHKYNRFMNKKSLGVWEKTEELAVATTKPTFGLTDRLDGVPLNVRLLINGGTKELKENDHDLAYQRNILSVLQSDLNFTVRESIRRKGDYGHLLENGTFDGAIGDFVRDDSMDLLAHDVSITDDRYQVVDFSAPVHYVYVGFLFKKPSRIPEPSIIIYFSPFSAPVWILIAIACLLFAAALVLFNRVQRAYNSPKRSEAYECAVRMPKIRSDEGEEQEDVCFNLVAILCGQGSSEFRKATSSSVLITTFGILALIIATSYSAVLNSYFTMMSSTVVVRNIHTLDLNPEYKLGMSTTYLDNFESHPRFEQIRKMLQEDKRNVITPGELGKAIDRIYKEKFVLIETSHALNQIRNVCSVRFIRLPITIMYTRHWMFKKYSPYSRIISKWINKMKISGVLSHLEDKYCQSERNLKDCPEEARRKPKFELEQVYVVFGIIAIGIVLAVVYLFFEIAATTIQKSAKQSLA